MKIPILYLIDRLALGGTEKQLSLLIRQLDRSGFEPHLCTLRPSSALFDRLEVPKVQLDLPSLGRPRTVREIARLAAYVRRHRIDLVQCFFLDSFFTGALLRMVVPLRLIGSFRDMGFWRTRGAALKMRACLPLFHGFIANSLAVRDHYVRQDRLSPLRVEVIYNGIDTDRLMPAAPPSRPVIGIVGNFTRPVKRMGDFVRAARRVLDRRPDVRFMVVGEGDLGRDLRELARRLGLEEAICFTGRVAAPEEYIRQFSVGVITSESEGLCNAILEYMACGLPVVATAAGGNGELVREGENGFLVPVGDVESLAGRLLQLLDAPELRRRMGARSRQEMLERFTVEKMVQRHQEYYQRLLSRPAAEKTLQPEKG